MEAMNVRRSMPWIEGPVLLHSSRAYKCSLKSDELCAYQQGFWRFWYESDHHYALPTIVFFCGIIGLFTLAHAVKCYTPSALHRTKPLRKITALARYLSYRSFRLRKVGWTSAPMSILLLGLLGGVYFLVMTLGPQPYYWPNTATVNFGGSPPLATRAGWLSLACMPFVFATAGKSNLISALTGVSYEKLPVFHRWISYAFFVLALVHTFPFIVLHLQKGDMVQQWNEETWYWTGTIALVAQAWLTFASISPLRKLCYEFFKLSHFIAAPVFVVFLFVHVDFRLSSWDYFIATAVIFSLSIIRSSLRTYLQYPLTSSLATLTLTPNNFIRVSIQTTSTWTVDQHFFLRFLSAGLGPDGLLSSHPFTVCSLPQRRSFEQEKRSSELVFYIRPADGLTAKLCSHVQAHPNAQMRVMLDGPYGGADMRTLTHADRSLVIAGGSGAGWTLPLIESHLRRQEIASLEQRQRALHASYRSAESYGLTDGGENGDAASSSSMRVVLVARDQATRYWYEAVVSSLLASYPESGLRNLEVHVFTTGGVPSIVDSQKAGAAYSFGSAPTCSGIGVHHESKSSISTLSTQESGSDTSTLAGDSRDDHETVIGIKQQWSIRDFSGRPNLKDIVASERTVLAKHIPLSVFSCGPSAMQSDVADAVAMEQLRILKDGTGEVYLHREHFEWA